MASCFNQDPFPLVAGKGLATDSDLDNLQLITSKHRLVSVRYCLTKDGTSLLSLQLVLGVPTTSGFDFQVELAQFGNYSTSSQCGSLIFSNSQEYITKLALQPGAGVIKGMRIDTSHDKQLNLGQTSNSIYEGMNYQFN